MKQMKNNNITFSDLSMPLKIAIVLSWLIGGLIVINLLMTIVMFAWASGF
jgi:uncharacterized integral membrane protein